jgi:hypothetical protein
MMRKNYYYMILFCAAGLMFTAGWATVKPKPMYDAAPASLAREYTSIAEMAQDSPLIVQAEVLTNPATINYMDVLFSTNRIKILKTLKGSPGSSEITILDNGGLYQGKEYGMGGMPLMHPGERYLLFLYKYEGPVINTEAYMIKGVWQGKIRINNGNVLEYVGPSEDTIEIQKDIKNHHLDTIQTQIR